jgi:ornithine decarboxylase
VTRTLGYWIHRYLPNELAGTACALAGAWLTHQLTGSLLAAAIVGTLAESAGFYGVAVARDLRAELARTPDRSARRTVAALRTAVGTAIEYGPAELVDTLAVRPALLYLAPQLTGSTWLGWLVGKVAADVVFYAMAAAGHLARRRLLRAVDDDRVLTASVRARRITELSAFAARVDLDALLREHPTPLAVIEPERAAEQYRRLAAALPSVRLHYALKALPHPAVLRALIAEDAWFDVAGDAEIDVLERLGVPPERLIDTRPVKSPAELTRSYTSGIRTFVVDSLDELAKFSDLPPDAGVLIRVAHRNPAAKSDLSAKFGAGADGAMEIAERAVRAGIQVVGLSFHAGSQLDDPDAVVAAVRSTLSLLHRIENHTGRSLSVLDIGGGFPVPYRRDVAPFEELAARLESVLAPHGERLTILAEPGRIIAAPAVTVVTRVIGATRREGAPWYTIDDGLYGGYSNVLTEQVHPVLVARRELDAPPVVLHPATLAGPTCDSVDVIARDYPMPELTAGDVVLSPMMGAYTLVTATTFNGRPLPAAVVVERAPAQPLVAAVD